MFAEVGWSLGWGLNIYHFRFLFVKTSYSNLHFGHYDLFCKEAKKMCAKFDLNPIKFDGLGFGGVVIKCNNDLLVAGSFFQ